MPLDTETLMLLLNQPLQFGSYHHVTKEAARVPTLISMLRQKESGNQLFPGMFVFLDQ